MDARKGSEQPCRESAAIRMSTLVINKSDSYHQECGPVKGNSSPKHTHCPGCNEQYAIVTSDYAGGSIEDWIRSHRPDLKADFPFENFWERAEGQAHLFELQMDEEQG